MINYIKNLFASDKQKLSDAVLTTQTTVVAVKTAAYHEIIPVPIGFTIRVYDRKTGGLLVETNASPKCNPTPFIVRTGGADMGRSTQIGSARSLQPGPPPPPLVDLGAGGRIGGDVSLDPRAFVGLEGVESVRAEQRIEIGIDKRQTRPFRIQAHYSALENDGLLNMK